MKILKYILKFKVLTIIVILFFTNSTLSCLEYFKGFDPNKNNSQYSIRALLKTKYKDGSKWNENYFHEAQFPEQGITIFNNLIFSSTFMGKKGCKFNTVITFNDGRRYTFNNDYGPEEFIIDNDRFYIKLGNDAVIELINEKKYVLHLSDKSNNVNLDLTYNIINPPQIFGDGVVVLDSNNYLSFSQPVCGAYVSGVLKYKDNTISLNGRGSIDHDYNSASPLKIPRKIRSFWLYNNKFSINIHTIILPNNSQVDRITIFKEGKILKSFLNTGLNYCNIISDNETKFSYPCMYTINYNDSTGDSINAVIKVNKLTDRIQVFNELNPVIHSIVAQAVGEMWAYRFWANAEFTLNINNQQEEIKINGTGNFVDTIKIN